MQIVTDWSCILIAEGGVAPVRQQQSNNGRECTAYLSRLIDRALTTLLTKAL